MAGQFWCASPAAAYRDIPQRRLPEPFQTAQRYVVKALRLTDRGARSGSPRIASVLENGLSSAGRRRLSVHAQSIRVRALASAASSARPINYDVEIKKSPSFSGTLVSYNPARGPSRISSTMLVRDSRTTSLANGAFGRHDRQKEQVSAFGGKADIPIRPRRGRH
jgi:hypothetical protein